MEITLAPGRELPSVAVTDILPLPQAALYVMSVARQPAVSADEVAQALGSDQSIALRFLSIANSAYFATTHRIATLQHCVAWLGLDFVCSTLVALGIDRVAADHPLPGFDRMAFWEHNLGVAGCSEMITSRLRLAVPGEAYLVGLCHDLGKLVMAISMGRDYRICLERSATAGLPLYELETDVLGLDHALVGASALREWKLSPEAVHLTLNHHEPFVPGSHGKLFSVLLLAQGMTGELLTNPDSPLGQQARARKIHAMRQLSLDEEFVSGLTADVEGNLAKVQSAVKAMTG